MSEQNDKSSQPADDLDAKMAKFEGNFIEACDIMQRPPVRVKISRVVPPNTERDSGKKLINRPILEFEGAKKRFVMGKTNERILKAWHGTKASGWIGKEIAIGVRFLKEAFGESNVPTLRIIPPPEVAIPMSARKHLGSEEPHRR